MTPSQKIKQAKVVRNILKSQGIPNFMMVCSHECEGTPVCKCASSAAGERQRQGGGRAELRGPCLGGGTRWASPGKKLRHFGKVQEPRPVPSVYSEAWTPPPTQARTMLSLRPQNTHSLTILPAVPMKSVIPALGVELRGNQVLKVILSHLGSWRIAWAT